ncbi:MAG: hypothetical protein R3Y27_02565 [Clostridia bacterium]
MKKIITILTVLAIVLSLSVTAFAATDTLTTDGETADQNVYATYVQTVVDVYSVDIIWGDMTFEYNDAFEGTWNAYTHDLDGATEAYWVAVGDNSITVVNHSNNPVNVDFSFEGEVSGTFSTNSVALATAVGTTYETAPTQSLTFNVTGGSISEDGYIGTITATLNID